ncbi:MAG: hypothetical protein A2808_02590 [Candidatus Moranbacteria bacterium RIFCSPHIGHO2_01_FULL_55_24]|nr:MAG: hypothetical protein A2808_02590 [Candidatus Moranbacteria bacterium RIFCSPHIGHO2_01_FULL_55_24]
MTIVKVSHLTYSYGQQISALQDVSFEVEKGDYLGILGGNGSGKTTLLRLLLGLEKIQGGEVELFGEPLNAFRGWQKIGYIPQNVFRGDLNFPASVLEVVRSGYADRNRKPSKMTAVMEALQLCGIGHLASRRLGELSGGERQRVFIARALVSEPELLVLDEPTTSIDTSYEEDLYTLLRKLHEKGMTIILVSHDHDVVSRDTRHILCLDKKVLGYSETKKISGEDLDRILAHGERVIHHRH